MTQSMAIALAKDKIRVNALLPGTIHTQLADHDMANDEKRKHLENRIPWGRVGKPDGLAGPAVFLASDKLSGFATWPSSWLTLACTFIFNRRLQIKKSAVKCNHEI